MNDIDTQEEALKYYKFWPECIKCKRHFGSDCKKKKQLCHYCETELEADGKKSRQKAVSEANKGILKEKYE